MYHFIWQQNSISVLCQFDMLYVCCRNVRSKRAEKVPLPLPYDYDIACGSETLLKDSTISSSTSQHRPPYSSCSQDRGHCGPHAAAARQQHIWQLPLPEQPRANRCRIVEPRDQRDVVSASSYATDVYHQGSVSSNDSNASSMDQRYFMVDRAGHVPDRISHVTNKLSDNNQSVYSWTLILQKQYYALYVLCLYINPRLLACI